MLAGSDVEFFIKLLAAVVNCCCCCCTFNNSEDLATVGDDRDGSILLPLRLSFDAACFWLLLLLVERFVGAVAFKKMIQQELNWWQEKTKSQNIVFKLVLKKKQSKTIFYFVLKKKKLQTKRNEQITNKFKGPEREWGA